MNEFNFTFKPNRLTHCGIVYQRGGRTGYDIMQQYKSQIARGTDGFGYVEIGKTSHRKRFTDELDTFYNLGQSTSKDIIFHHRIPTSTANKSVCNHPIFSDQYDHNYYLVHNGIIWNAKDLFKYHEEMDIKYETKIGKNTFNDSECLLHELALYLEGKSKTIDCEGSIAFILLQTDKQNKPLNLYYGRNTGNPLKLSNEKGVFRLASELVEGTMINPDILYSYNYKTKKTTSVKLDIGQDYTYCGSGGRGHIGVSKYNEKTGKWEDEMGGLYDYYDNYQNNSVTSSLVGSERGVTPEVQSMVNGLYELVERYYNGFDIYSLEKILDELPSFKSGLSQEFTSDDQYLFDSLQWDIEDYIEELNTLMYGENESYA